jgi:glycosyltransferase involved in cell wall biosynthesis
MKVLLLTRYSRLGASSRLRMMQYLPYLEDHGIKVTVTSLLGDRYLHNLYSGDRRHLSGIIDSYLLRLIALKNVGDYDLLWIEKELFPGLPALGERLLNLLKIPYVVDYDDAIFHNYDRHPNYIVRSLLGRKIDTVMRHAALVIAGSEYLANRARQSGASWVEVIPTVIDLDRYSLEEASVHDDFVVGWVGQPGNVRYLSLIQPALAKLFNTGGVKLKLVGSGPLVLEGVPTEIVDWSEETEVAQIKSFDVGIMPILDDFFERGKCGYKLIQCMACSKPVVASPVGVNREIVQPGLNGFLAETQGDWVEALNTLRTQSELRRRLGQSGRNKVETTYCLQVIAPRLLALLHGAADAASRGSDHVRFCRHP